MIICEFCRQFQEGSTCALGVRIPKGMRCHEFDPSVEKFCANPSDFKGAGQIIQMATFFGVKGMELKKIKQIAAQEEQVRSILAGRESEPLPVKE
jgi:hypothetical protein